MRRRRRRCPTLIDRGEHNLIVACLLAAGAEPSVRDDFGFAVEDWAKIELEDELAEVLALLRPAQVRAGIR